MELSPELVSKIFAKAILLKSHVYVTLPLEESKLLVWIMNHRESFHHENTNFAIFRKRQGI